jgi:hypothetical protein
MKGDGVHQGTDFPHPPPGLPLKGQDLLSPGASGGLRQRSYCAATTRNGRIISWSS